MKNLVLVLLSLLAVSCNDLNLGEDVTGPSNLSKNKIEFRVFGTQLTQAAVTIRHTNSVDGMTNFTGLLPYVSTFESKEDSIFLYVEANATSLSNLATLQVQIFVDGKLFREGTSQGFLLYSQAAGTFRR